MHNLNIFNFILKLSDKMNYNFGCQIWTYWPSRESNMKYIARYWTLEMVNMFIIVHNLLKTVRYDQIWIRSRYDQPLIRLLTVCCYMSPPYYFLVSHIIKSQNTYWSYLNISQFLSFHIIKYFIPRIVSFSYFVPQTL